MSILNLGAQRVNANTAGLTSSEPNVTEAERVARGTAPLGSYVTQPALTLETTLSDIFRSGTHPESLVEAPLTVASTDLARATDSIRGPLGGLVPRARSTVATGPSGGVAQVRSNAAKAQQIATSALRRVGLVGPASGVNPGGPERVL